LRINKLSEELEQLDAQFRSSKLYEKRLMYLIYLAVEEGYPVDKLYEDKVGNITTNRFEEMTHHLTQEKSSLMDSLMLSTVNKEDEIRLVDQSERSSQIFDSNASYKQIYSLKPVAIVKKPA
jgi:hypothetical protein